MGSWIESHPEGIYVRPADAWIDPSESKSRAFITHGHSDHA
ncbi:MAG TPA: DNA ligase-associated DEXH box helicase, partial [Sphingomicrobium sp.]|nr:DNA ligase-associated DEXH box helicase [Sphingomicrobium sp.]